MVEQLIEKAAGGARGLAIFLTLEDSRVLLRAVQRAVVTSRLLRHQLVLLAPSAWGNNKELVSGKAKKIRYQTMKFKLIMK